MIFGTVEQAPGDGPPVGSEPGDNPPVTQPPKTGPHVPGQPVDVDPMILPDTRIEARIWRLTPVQYNGELRRIFGESTPQSNLPMAASEKGITNISATAFVDPGNVNAFSEAARSVGNWVAEQGASAARCDSWGTPACVESFLDWFPQELYRRPLSATERTELRTLFDDLARDYDYNYAFSGMVRGMLMSPEFLYRTELGAEGQSDEVIEMTGIEIANLMAFSIVDRGPDEELLRDAERLSDPDVRESHARRLMADSSGVWERFFWEWLHLDTLESQGNEVGLEPQVVAQMHAEYSRFIDEIIITDRGSLRDLLTTSHTWIEPELAQHYGVNHPGSGVERVDLDPSQRSGLLTMGAWLVAHGKRGRANVVRRGMALYKEAMCNQIKAPENFDVNEAQAELVSPDATVREIVEVRGNAPVCGGCHQIADPAGLVFENFAGNGSWQTTYATDNLPVEPQISLEGLGDFDNAAAFSAALADDQAFQHCLVERFAHFMLGIDVGSPAAIRWQHDVHKAFTDQGTSFEELLVAIVRQPAYIERRQTP